MSHCEKIFQNFRKSQFFSLEKKENKTIFKKIPNGNVTLVAQIDTFKNVTTQYTHIKSFWTNLDYLVLFTSIFLVLKYIGLTLWASFYEQMVMERLQYLLWPEVSCCSENKSRCSGYNMLSGRNCPENPLCSGQFGFVVFLKRCKQFQTVKIYIGMIWNTSLTPKDMFLQIKTCLYTRDVTFVIKSHNCSKRHNVSKIVYIYSLNMIWLTTCSRNFYEIANS